MSTPQEPLLKVRNLQTRFFTEAGQVNAVEGVSFDVDLGKSFGIVGESGSGKSVTAESIMGIVNSPGQITGGSLWFRDANLASSLRDDRPEIVDGDFVDLTELPAHIRRRLRGSRISMVFQDPMTSFDPTYTVGEQIAEAVEVQRRAEANPRSLTAKTKNYGLISLLASPFISSQRFVSEESYERAIELLDQVGIPDPEERADEYPHQFSGGMLQRGMIAQAMAGDPDLLVADEPTSALDVTIQLQVLELLKELQQEVELSIILITHNLGVIAKVCDHVGVMYAGEIVERGSLEQILEKPAHPYTKGLFNSIPEVDRKGERLEPIEGNVPTLYDSEMGDKCYFVDRCPRAMESCLSHPDEQDVPGEDGHKARCVLVDEAYDPTEAIDSEFMKKET